MLHPDVKPIANSIVDTMMERLSDKLSDIKAVLEVEVLALLNDFTNQLEIVHPLPPDPRSVPQYNAPQTPPGLDGIVPSPPLRRQNYFVDPPSQIKSQASSPSSWPSFSQNAPVTLKAALSWRTTLLTLLDVERVSSPVVWNGWGVFSCGGYTDGKGFPRLMCAIVFLLVLLVPMLWEVPGDISPGFENEGIGMEMLFDVIFRSGTLVALICFVFGHHANKSAVGPGQELELMEELLRQSGVEPCKHDGLSEFRSFFIVLCFATAAVASVLFGLSDEREDDQARGDWLSFVGFSCAATLHLALLFRLRWCFQRLRRIIVNFGHNLAGRELSANRGLAAVHQWCALEAACQCFSRSYSPVLFFILLVPPVQILSIVLALSTSSDITLPSCVAIVPYLVLFAAHVALVHTICDINRLGREIPRLVAAQVATNFLHPQFNQFTSVLHLCAVELKCFGFRLDFATVTRGLYMGIVVLLTSGQRLLENPLN